MKPKIAKWLYKSKAKLDPKTHGALRCRLYDMLLKHKMYSTLNFTVDFFKMN